jgi:glycosyltransferase involved in cell wall biosynthesis
MRPTMTEPGRPRLCFIGPMHGRRHGFATSQGLILSDLFAGDGYQVVAASTVANRYGRFLDIAFTIARTHQSVDVQCLEVYSGPSFVVEDVASFIGRAFGHRVIMTLHGGGMPDFMARYPNWTRRVLGRADALVCPSRYLQRAVAEHGFHAELIPNVIDLTQYDYRHRPTPRPRLFWMRAFHSLWNPHMALRVLRRVRDVEPDATLVMAGQDKGLLDDVRTAAAAMGLADAVTFPGFLDATGKRRFGNAADIFMTTNRIDNMPVAVVEACAMGMPVVSTRVGGVPDLLEDGCTGLLTPDDDDAAMAEAVLRLIRDTDLSSRLSRNGRELAERSAWPAVQPLWNRLFDRVRAHPRASVQQQSAAES